MSRELLLEMARRNLAHAEADTLALAPDVHRVRAEHYCDESRWNEEMRRIFRRLPLLLATTAELRRPGDYKALDAAGVPVLITRAEDGEVRAFVNMCSHRGAQVMEEGCGNARRFSCPYHAWSYNTRGELVGIYCNRDFGNLDKSQHGLTPLPVLEKAGLVWVVINPESALDIKRFLCGYDELLEHFGFANWHYFASQVIPGPNWKIAYDGYMDLYHLPILHKNTFGPDYPNKALYYSWGPHQRVGGPDASLADLRDRPEADWPLDRLLKGVWTIFPHVSIAGFDGGGRSVMISQLFPGARVGESWTVQNYLMEREPNEAEAREAREQFKFLRKVVEEEDYATGLKQQRALRTGARPHVLFGRNEAGGHNFHRWVDKLLDTDDEQLNDQFAPPPAGTLLEGAWFQGPPVTGQKRKSAR